MLANREGINSLSEVNWSFEFEEQPYFAGSREMASNGLDKPVLNTFRAFGMLGSEQIKATSSGTLPADEVLQAGVRGKPDINAIATRKDSEVEIMIWNYHDDDLPAPAAAIDLIVEGLPAKASRGLSEHFRIDSSHSNSFAAWKEMGSPQNPSPAQYRQLENAGQLQLLNSPVWIPIERGSAHLQFALPRQGVSLLRIAW